MEAVAVKYPQGAFIVWKKFQRRVEVLAPQLDLEIHYFHYPWEERSKLHKLLSYCFKSVGTLSCLFRRKPRLVFVQFPPPPTLYCVAFYCWLTRSRWVADCHMTEGNSHWLRWFGTKRLLTKSLIIVHNEHIKERIMADTALQPIVLRDGIAERKSTGGSQIVENLGLAAKSYVVVPSSYSIDEPLREIIGAAGLMPDIALVMTWYSERLSPSLRNSLPNNIILTGYLDAEDFNYLFVNAGAALVLTKEENVQLSGMQEAMAFEVPAIVSDLKTTRFLYRDYPVYVANEPHSIADGIRLVLQDRQYWIEQMRCLRRESEQEYCTQIAQLRLALNL